MDNSESKVEIIKVASTGPLAFFSLVVIVAIAGLLAVITQVDDPEAKLALTIGMVLLLVLMVVFTGTKMILQRSNPLELPSHGSLLGNQAVKGFFQGNSTRLAGRWEVTWKKLDEQGNEIDYTIKDENTGAEIPYPAEIASIKTHGALVSVENFDSTTERIYYLEGRLSSKNIVTLIYWSKPDISEMALVGSLLLEYKESYGSTVMTGDWTGYDRTDKIVKGRVYWHKMDK